MISVKNIFHSAFLASLAAVILSSCANDMFEAPDADEFEYDRDTQLVINLNLPEAMLSDTRAEAAPVSNEAAVNSLTLIAFPQSGGIERRSLPLPEDMPKSPAGSPAYQIKGLIADNYRIFVLANIPENLLNGVNSENDLKNVILDYSQSLPTPGNLPMVYEPSASTYIPAEASANPTVQTLSLKFACVKLRYNIIFDKSNPETASIFGNNGLVIKSVRVENVSKSTYLLSRTDKLAESRTVAVSGKYYQDFTNTPGNASVNNKYVVNGVGNALAKPEDFNSKWLFQGAVYIPERYAKSASEQVRLLIQAYVPDASGNEASLKCNYTINLGQYDGAPAGTMALERNTLYEVIASVKSLGNAELDAKIVTKNWMEQLLPVDMIHTRLSLSKTRLSVKSLENDELTYSTDGRGGVEIVCETSLPFSETAERKAALIFTEDQQNHKITVRVNPEVDITTLGNSERKGVAKCYIKAGNIKKYFDVDYDITPFFIIDEKEVRIQWDNDEQIRTKYFTYTTNLGGLRLTNESGSTLITPGKTYAENTVGSSKVIIRCANPSAATGTFTVTSVVDPVTTQIQPLKAYPYKYDNLSEADRNLMENKGMEDLTITLMPPFGNYRIYFRPINDYHAGKRGEATTSEFLHSWSKTLTFPYGDTWIDFWDNEGNNSINSNTHRIYIYTQKGETTGTDPNAPVWKFTKTYGERGNEMKGDNNNTGWYYYDLGYQAEPVSTEHLDKASEADKNYYNRPRPGETLMIFTNAYEEDLGYTLHRASHHLDPGISLFDFEDREGYVIYDPTCEPYYFIYDEKPQIEDYTYTIYSDCQLSEWYIAYGNASNNVPTQAQRYTLHSKTITSVKQNGMWKNTFVLKRVKGENSKAIILKFDLSTSVAGYNPPQRVYLGMYGTNWDRAPRAYFYTDGGGIYKQWTDTDAMSVLPGSDGNIYYIDVPAGYENGRVIFQNNSRTQQMPASDGYQLVKGKSKISYTNNSGFWEEYNPGGSSSGIVESQLFNGRAVTGPIYFNASTSKWSTSKNF